jgi:hypothetical protein
MATNDQHYRAITGSESFLGSSDFGFLSLNKLLRTTYSPIMSLRPLVHKAQHFISAVISGEMWIARYKAL